MRARAVVVMGVLSISLVTGGWLVERGLKGPTEPRVNTARLLEGVMSHVARLYVDSLGRDELYQKAVDGMLMELHDPHSVYLRPERLKRLNETTTGNYAGVGLQVDLRDGWPTVITPVIGGPGERSGVQSGDRIVEIAGKTTKGWTVDETIRALRGPLGTDIAIALERPGSRERLPFTLSRDIIHRRAVARTALLPDAVGYVDVNVFSDSTEEELSKAVDSLAAAGMKSLILDLRGNPGGLLTQGVSVSDLFLDANLPIVSMRGRVPDANRSFADEAAQRWPALNIVVLIDDGSASASEIVAGALQDHDRAVVLGIPSYGKGSAQSLYPVTAGGALKLTTARWYTPSGRSIDKSRAERALNADVPDDDLTTDEQSDRTKTYRTTAGRTVFGGGGITPDVVVGDTALHPEEQALSNALGRKVPQFRDALTAVALGIKTRGGVASENFIVTADMRDALWKMMGERGIDFERSTFDAASPLVDRLLGIEIARYVFSPAAANRRSIAGDEIIASATALLRGVRSQKELLDRAAARSPRR